jgi:hypothetical protein
MWLYQTALPKADVCAHTSITHATEESGISVFDHISVFIPCADALLSLKKDANNDICCLLSLFVYTLITDSNQIRT